MSDPERRERRNSFLSRRRQKQSFIGNDDDTDEPDFDKGSWAAVLFVLIVIGIAVAFIFGYAN